jgi:type IV pilus assembly protein PilE
MRPKSRPLLTAQARGFSLIELMVVLVVLGIIASIAFPSYFEYRMRANRSAAQQFMMAIANRQEQYVLDARAYTDVIGTGGLGLSVPADVAPLYAIAITLQPGPPRGFTVTATPSGYQAKDGVISLTSTGVKSPPGKW